MLINCQYCENYTINYTKSMKDKSKKTANMNIEFTDKQNIHVRGELECGTNVKIDINTIFEGYNLLGNNVEIKANCIIKNAIIGDGSIIKPYTSLEGTKIGNNCSIGPYSNLRNETIINDNVSIGNFVEIKKSNVGSRSRINHLSFIGDANIEEDVTIGAGTITCNHDGMKHNTTNIKKGSYIGSGCKLIAPITIGENSTIGSGSVITKDTSPGKLTIARSEQTVIENWKMRNTE